MEVEVDVETKADAEVEVEVEREAMSEVPPVVVRLGLDRLR
jgi:hypothetical protein